MKGFSKIRRYLFITFAVLVIAGLLTSFLLGKNIPWNEIRSYVSESTWAPVAFIVIYIGLSVFIPTTPLMAIAGLLFGFVWGIIYTTIAGFFAATLIFYISRKLGKDFVETMVDKERMDKFHSYYDKSSRHKIFTVALLRMLPIMPFNFLSLVLGVSRLSFYEYIAGTVLGL